MADPWPTPGSWIYGWIDTDVPGYRGVTIGATAVTVTAGYYRWPDYVTQLDTDLTSAASWAAAANAFGQITLSGASAVVTWRDRLGWLCGMASEPTQATPAAVTSVTSIRPPPAGIPLISAQIEGVSVEAARELRADRNLRAFGYAFGSARLWRWRLTMHYTSALALQQLALRSGKVTVASYAPANFGSSSAWSSSNLDGHLDAHIVQIEGAAPLPGPTRDFWEATIVVVEAGP